MEAPDHNYQEIKKYYQQKLETHGDTPQGLAWPNQEDMELRYRVMLEGVKGLKNPLILDWGCGTGRFLEYLQKVGYSCQYSGIDINPQAIELCKEKFKDQEFNCLDLMASPLIKQYDYIVCNGVYTVKNTLSQDEMMSFLHKSLVRLFEKCHYGLAFNLMSHQVDWFRDDLFHVPLDTIMSFAAKNLTRHLTIRNDYGLYEYTVYVFKQPLRIRSSDE